MLVVSDTPILLDARSGPAQQSLVTSPSYPDSPLPIHSSGGGGKRGTSMICACTFRRCALFHIASKGEGEDSHTSAAGCYDIAFSLFFSLRSSDAHVRFDLSSAHPVTHSLIHPSIHHRTLLGLSHSRWPSVAHFLLLLIGKVDRGGGGGGARACMRMCDATSGTRTHTSTPTQPYTVRGWGNMMRGRANQGYRRWIFVHTHTLAPTDTTSFPHP